MNTFLSRALAAVAAAAFLAGLRIFYVQVLLKPGAVRWWQKSLWPPWELLPVPVEAVEKFRRFVTGTVYVEMNADDPPRLISLGLFRYLCQTGREVRRTSWRSVVTKTRAVHRFEIRMRCKDPTCRYEFISGHMGELAVFDTLDEALSYLRALKARDRIALRKLLGLQVDANGVMQLSERLTIECPKCRRLFPYGPDEHYIKRHIEKTARHQEQDSQ